MGNTEGRKDASPPLNSINSICFSLNAQPGDSSSFRKAGKEPGVLDVVKEGVERG